MTRLRFFGLAVLAPFFLLTPLSAQVTTFSFEQTFLNPSPDPGDAFGSYTTAAISNGAGGYNVVIGAFLDDTRGTDAGAVYVIDRVTGGLVRILYSPHPAAGDNFGETVAAIGNNIVVGAPGDSTAGPGRGAAYLFDGATGALLLTFLPPLASVGARFGFPVVAADDLNGDGKPEVLVGGPSDTVSGIAGAGAVYLFDGATGNLLRTIENPDPGDYDIFGIFAAVEGGKILVGAAWDWPCPFGYQAGSAYLFSAGTGELLRRFVGVGCERQAHFGEWLALSQNRVIATAHLKNVDIADLNVTDAGAAYIFGADTGALLHILQSPAPTVGGQFGYGLAVSGSDVLIGASGEDGGNGVAYLFDAVLGRLTSTFHPPTPGLDPSFGLPVGFVGPDVLVGGWGINTTPQSGSVSVFRRTVVPYTGTQFITTFAGNGTAGYNGDGIPAVSASLNLPYDVALDSTGSLIIADSGNHRVRKVTAGTISTIAGRDVEGYNGDGIAAVNARLDSPHGVAVDRAGNVFIADSNNHRIRRVDALSGIITTVAGNGIASYGGDGGLATQASLNWPLGVAVDGQGNLIIADFYNNRVRRVDAATNIITTLAGTGVFGYTGDGGPGASADLTSPTGVGVDGVGNVYVALLHSHAVRRVDASTGIITTVAGTGAPGFSGDGGPATSAQLQYPYRVTVDSAGNLFIADTENNRVREVDAGTGVINTIAGYGDEGFYGDGGSPLNAMFCAPLGIAVDSAGNWFVADFGNHRVRRVGTPIPLPTATVSGTAAICKGAATIIQAALTGAGPWNLTWSDGVTQTAIAASPATRSVAPNATTTYTVTSVSDTNAIGTQSGSAAVTVELPPKATVSGDATICAGSSATIQADLTGIPPWNLVWSDGFTQTVSASPSTRTVSPSTQTIYAVTAVSDAACAGNQSGSATIKVDPLPSAAIAAPASVCANSSGNAASVPNAGSGATYAWAITNGTITSGAGTRAIKFTAGPSGSVGLTVVVTKAGCSSTGSASLAVNPLPSVAITAPSSVCRNSTGNVASVPDAGAGATYAWTIMNGTISSGAGANTITFSAGNKNVTLSVTVTNSSGCSSSSSTVVPFNPGC